MARTPPKNPERTSDTDEPTLTQQSNVLVGLNDTDDPTDTQQSKVIVGLDQIV